MAAEDVVSHAGVWWPSADEHDLRHAAAGWRRLADALHAAADTGRAGAIEVGAQWNGEAADRFAESWRAHERLLTDDATGCLALEAALLTYADAVAQAKHEIEEIAVTAGATIIVGVGLAWATFGVSAAAAGEVTAGLVAAATAVGVELSSTVAAVTATALVGATFGAGEAAVVDTLVTQPVRVELFGDGGYSAPEVGDAATMGALTGVIVGGAVGYGAARPMARIAAGDLGGLRAPGGRIRAALDPTNWGPQGIAFRAGVHETPDVFFKPNEIGIARRLAGEGNSVHARSESTVKDVPSPDAFVRASRGDPGRYVEFKQPEEATATAVKNEIRKAGRQLRPYGGGELLIDGRDIGLTEEVAQKGMNRALGENRVHGAALPDTIYIILANTEIIYP